MALLSITGLQLLMAGVIFFCGFLSATAPLVLVDRNEVLFSAGNMLAAGVLLAAGLVHQLAESAGNLAGEDEEPFPWSYAICGTTFILFLMLEESIHILMMGKHHSRPHDCQGTHTSQPAFGGNEETPKEQNEETPKEQNEETPKEEDEDTAAKPQRMSELSTTVFGEPRETVHHHHDEHIAEHLHGSLVAVCMLLTALSVHSVLAGLSIGIVDNVDDIYSTAVAIVTHKVFAGYALGSTLATANLNVYRSVFLATVFSISTPTGILVGMAISSFDEESNAVGIIQAIVAGTFLYVSIMEVAIKELLMCRHSDKEQLPVSLTVKQVELLKLMAMLAGFCGMSLLAKWI